LSRSLRADCYQDRRHPSHLDFTLNRDDRAVTNVWSASGKHHDVGSRLFVDVLGNRRSSLFVHSLELHRVSHEANVAASEPSDETFFCQQAKRVNRKDYIDVVVCIRVVVVMMSHHQIPSVRIGIDYSESQIAKLIRDVESLLIFLVNAGGRHDRNTGPRKLALVRSERHALAMQL